MELWWRVNNVQAQQTRSQVPRFNNRRDLYVDTPAELSISFSISLFNLLFCILLMCFYFIFYGEDCDEDNELPLLMTVRTLAGRIEPNTIATTEFRSSPFSILLWFLFFRSCFDLNYLFTWMMTKIIIYISTLGLNESMILIDVIHSSESYFWSNLWICWFASLYTVCVYVKWWNLKWILRTPSYTAQFQTAQWMRKNISAPDANQLFSFNI